MYTQGCPAEIQTPAHWNQFGRSMTSPPPVFFHHLRLVAHSLRKEKFGALLKNVISFFQNCVALMSLSQRVSTGASKHDFAVVPKRQLALGLIFVTGQEQNYLDIRFIF
jgi:hypothetical protein